MSKHFQLSRHPWLAMLAVMLAFPAGLILFSNILTGLLKQPPDAQPTEFAITMLAHITVLFLLVPFIFKLPEGTSSFKAYLDAIRLSRGRPFFRLLLLALSCFLVLAICQIAGVLVYRVSQDLPITREFIRGAFILASLFPSEPWSWLGPVPSIFEEVAFRGVVLSAFLSRYSKPKAILFSALGFGAMHLLNLAGGRELVWVLGQFVWSAILGLFYGVLVLKSNSLWPAMLVHYLGNFFIGSLTAYMQTNASVQAQAIYGILFFFGFIPTTLMILWIFQFTKIWPISVPHDWSKVSVTQSAAAEQR